MWPVATLWVAGRFCAVKSWKSRNYLVISAVLTCLRLIKTFCISLSKLHGRFFTIFAVYIVFVFLACFFNGVLASFLAIDFRRGRVHRSVRSIHSRQRVSGVLYIPFIHSIDTMQKIGVWEWVVI